MSAPPAPPPPKPARRQSLARQVLAGAFVGAIFALGGFLLVRGVLGEGPPEATSPVPTWARIAWGLAVLPVAYLGGVLVHELGHLIAGRLVGFRLLLLIVGPLRLYRTGQGWRLARNRSFQLTGGLAGAVPTSGERLRPRMACVLAAGPLASLATTAAAAAGFSLLPAEVAGSVWAAEALRTLCFLAAVVNGFLSLVSLWPGTGDGFHTDGARLLRALRGGPQADQEIAVLALTACSMNRMRPRDYPPDLVAAATALRDGSVNDLYGHVFALAHAYDRGRIEEAGGLGDYVVARDGVLPAISRDTIRADYAYFVAHHRRDPATARAWLERAGAGEWAPASRHRAEAAIALAEGRLEAARASLAAARAALTTMVGDFVTAEFGESLDRIEAATHPPGPPRTA